MKRNRLSDSDLEASEICLGATSVAQLDEPAGHFATSLSPALLADLDEVNRTYPSPSAQ